MQADMRGGKVLFYVCSAALCGSFDANPNEFELI